VLLVEDNPVNAIVAEAELRNLGLDVTVMRNGREAIDWLACEQPDLVLMDCEMPELDGLEATRRIRAQEQATGREPLCIVALTANGMDGDAQRCRRAGMNGHLAKPYRPEELVRVVRRHLRPRMRLCAG
jgi:CheY-like chemotaxis protein